MTTKTKSQWKVPCFLEGITFGSFLENELTPFVEIFDVDSGYSTDTYNIGFINSSQQKNCPW